MATNRELVQQAWHQAMDVVLKEPESVEEYIPDMGAWMLRLLGNNTGKYDVDWSIAVTILECLGFTLDGGVLRPLG